MSSRSSSSSSDILGPAGDSEYLLSSPTKPFGGGRQPFMSPAANFKLLQTPGSVKGKRQRMSLSPSKSAHSIRFDDVLLPATPALAKLTGAQRMSLSPDKGQAEGSSANPWRIRVTLEATQDEEDEANNQGSPTRRVLYPSTTMTTKVPLKDERGQAEPTPRRRRGRPRKTEIQPLPDATPIPASPGHTPGAKNGNLQNRGRGRPRKGTPVPVERQVEEQPTPVPDPEPQQSSPLNLEPTPVPEPRQRRYSPLNLGTEKQPTPLPEYEQREYSPLNLGADGDSEDDELPDAPLPVDDFQGEDETTRPDPTDWNRHSPRVTFEEPAYQTPDVGAIDRDEDDGNLHSTPSKMPSSVRQEPINSSPANIMHAGHTPRVHPRLYPTPTSSSLVDEDNHEEDHTDEQEPRSEPHDTQGQATNDPAGELRDPTDEHREFDSIMESEGFSMVSLDTLPSAKQHGISTNSDRAKGPLRPFLQRESIGKRENSKRKASALDSNRDENARGVNVSPNSEPADGPPPKRQSRSPVHQRRPEQPGIDDKVPQQNAPLSPPADISAPTPIDYRPRPISRLARIVRAGLALEGAFRQQEGLEKRPNTDDSFEIPKQRLERVFGDLAYDTQQELRAGLGLGQEIAKKKIQAEAGRERAQQEAARNAAEQQSRDQDVGEAAEEEEEDTSETPQREQESIQDTSGTEMGRRMAEWQQERKATSRKIEKANSSQVIVINSDDDAPRSPEAGRAYPAFDVGGPDSDSGSDLDQGPGFEPGSEGNLPEDEAGELEEVDQAGKEAEEEEAEIEEEQENEEEEEQQLQPQPHQEEQMQEEEEEEEEEEDDDGYEDIWQQEAKEHSQISHQSSTHQASAHQSSTRHYEDDAGYRQESSPWKDDRSVAPSEYGGAYSPAPWTHEREKVPYLGGQSRVRQLREQEVDLSMLLRASNTPNHRYYYGKSSPASTASRRSPQRAEAAPQSSLRYAEYEEHGQEQPLSEFGLESSPLKPSDDDAFQVDPTTRIEHERMRADRLREQGEEYSDAAVAEERSIDGSVDMTPHPPRPANPANPYVQGSTWFQRLASLTPGWLKAPIRRSPARPSRVSEESEDSDDDPVSDDASAEDANAHYYGVDGADVDEQDEMERRFRTSRRFTEWRQHEEPQSSPESRAAQHPDRTFSALGEESPVRPRPLAVSGYFTDEHYTLLRRLYRLATQFPERFTYYPAPGRDQIIGDWIWTSDGRHGVPVTEGQFAVIDQFVQELATSDIDSGGTGQIGWTEADLHRRLISVIIGEKIRGERKAKMSGGDM